LGSAVIEGDKVKFKIGEYRNEPVATDVTKITET
jgi:cold shock CspA family protein